MSNPIDNIDHERTLESQNRQIIDLLKAILIGIEIIADQENGSLIEDIDEG